jgi:hypothetical protein
MKTTEKLRSAGQSLQHHRRSADVRRAEAVHRDAIGDGADVKPDDRRLSKSAAYDQDIRTALRTKTCSSGLRLMRRAEIATIQRRGKRALVMMLCR